MNSYPRAELTVREKLALGKLLHGPLVIAPADPRNLEYEALMKRGGWVEKDADGRYALTSFGRLAYYTGRVTMKGIK